MRRSSLVYLLLWLGMAVPLFSLLGRPSVQRTQEARVLETAREMLGTGLTGWMVPHLNNEIRLKKPPLAYWIAGAAFSIGGVNDVAGRTPFAFCGWLTIGLAWLAARRLYDARVALLSALLLGGCLLFIRNMRLSETDAPASLFVTGAITALLYATTAPISSRGRLIAWHAAAALAGLAAMAKGGPVVFPLLFIVAASIALRENLAAAVWRSGALITLAVVALPWFIFIATTHRMGILAGEMRNNLSGGDHGAPPWAYLPWLASGLLPWTIAAIVALIHFVQLAWKRQASPSDKLLLAWLIAVALPLSLTGNKQQHYLLPLTPPVMIATAALLGRTFDRSAPIGMRRLGVGILLVTAIALIGAAIAGQVAIGRLHVSGGPLQAAVIIVAAIALAAILLCRRSPAAAWLILTGGVAAFFAPTLACIIPFTSPHDPRSLAADIRMRFGDAPLVFYGPNISLPLCYNLRRAVPQMKTADDLIAFREAHRDVVVIAQDKAGRNAPAPPAPFVAAGPPVVADDQSYAFYHVR